MTTTQIPILTYHSAQVDGLDYSSNDHHALASDLLLIQEEGFHIIPLFWIVDWLRGERPTRDLDRAVAISFDDGCSMDFLDMDHPTWGRQRSFYNILRDFDASHPGCQPHLHATSFVIGSPATRAALGANLAGPEWISDEWWAPAVDSGLIAIENHSWDHNHPASPAVIQRDGVRGRFDNVETFDECDSELSLSSDYIASITTVRPTLFAYPWGQASSYFANEYFPQHTARHACRGAFTAHDGFVTAASSVWAIPRLVFRANWSTPAELRSLLLSTNNAGRVA